jgi:hypothetical protein
MARCVSREGSPARVRSWGLSGSKRVKSPESCLFSPCPVADSADSARIAAQHYPERQLIACEPNVLRGRGSRAHSEPIENFADAVHIRRIPR